TDPPPPTLTVSNTTVARGAQVTVTLANGRGGPQDWMSFVVTSSPNDVHPIWTWVGNGVTTRTWTVTAPNTAGTYEFRLFLNNSYTRAATSAPVTVTGGAAPATQTVNATSDAGGRSATDTVNGGAGGAPDGLAPATTGSA